MRWMYGRKNVFPADVLESTFLNAADEGTSMTWHGIMGAGQWSHGTTLYFDDDQ